MKLVFQSRDILTILSTMAHVLWISCFTLFVAVALAEAWLPTGMVRFRQRLAFRTSQKNRILNSSEHNNDDDDNNNDDNTNNEAAAEQRRLSLLPWWEDSWSEAFLSSFPYIGNSSNDTALAADELAHLLNPQPNPSAHVLHFCFLLHGHRGFSTDLSYLRRVMQHHAELEKKNQQLHDMVVHNAVCNEGKTMDGVVNGGERLVIEILQVIRGELERRNEQQSHGNQTDIIQDITISIVGNSLGGIYGRYAIARLAQKAANPEQHPHHPELTNFSTHDDDEQGISFVLLDGKYRLHFNIFCTTASPHLGISKHTYVPIPRSVEVGAAHVLGETGRDLFRLNDLMKTMATCPTFLEPLRKFRKRVAYANAFATDFPVPATTAAFLSAQSTYPHHFVADNNNRTVDNESDTDNTKIQGNRHVVATLQTPPAAKNPLPLPNEEAIVDDLVQMSYSLDSLGWKKVFIDLRKEIPLRVALPRSISLRKSIEKGTRKLKKTVSRFQSNNDSAPTDGQVVVVDETNEESDGYESEDQEESPSAIHRLREKGIVESRDVASLVSTPHDMRLSFPMGHNLMVALDRTGISGALYKGGRPVMDSLAQELVHDIFDWNFQEENQAAKETIKLGGNSLEST